MIINNELDIFRQQKENNTMYDTENLDKQMVLGFKRKYHQIVRNHFKDLISKGVVSSDSENNWRKFNDLEEIDFVAIKEPIDLDLKQRILNDQLSFDELLNILNERSTDVLVIAFELGFYDNIGLTNKVFDWLFPFLDYTKYNLIHDLIAEYFQLKGIRKELKPLIKETEMNDEIVLDGSGFDSLNEDSFFDSEKAKDPTGKPIEENDYAMKVRKKNAQGEVLIESIIKNSLRSIIPVSNLATYGLTQFTGIDVYAPISKRPFIAKHDLSLKERLTTTNLDHNIIYNMAPDALLVASKMIKNRNFELAASASPLLFQLAANIKERGNALKFDPDSNEIDLGQVAALSIPLIVKLIEPYLPKINTDSFNNFIPQNKSIWGIIPGANFSAASPTYNGRHELRRNVTQPHNI